MKQYITEIKAGYFMNIKWENDAEMILKINSYLLEELIATKNLDQQEIDEMLRNLESFKMINRDPKFI